jgi:hypothetical protein
MEKVELFANQLTEVFTPHNNTLDPEVEREFSNTNPKIGKPKGLHSQ